MSIFASDKTLDGAAKLLQNVFKWQFFNLGGFKAMLVLGDGGLVNANYQGG